VVHLPENRCKFFVYRKIKGLRPLRLYVVSVLTIHRYLENLSLNLSPKRRETLNFPPSRNELGGLGQSLAFPHDLNCQVSVGVGI
jgi:hypothetical protein